MMKPKVTDKEAAERIKKMKPFAILRGAKLEVFDLGLDGIQITISEPGNPESCMAVRLKMGEISSLATWIMGYSDKVLRAAKNGKS